MNHSKQSQTKLPPNRVFAQSAPKQQQKSQKMLVERYSKITSDDCWYPLLFPFPKLYLLFQYQGYQREWAARYFTFRNEGFARHLYFEPEEEDNDKRYRLITACKDGLSEIHFGAVYPRITRSGQQFPTAIGKELIFDIDLNSYEDVRPCCKSMKKACPKCWVIGDTAMRIIDRVMNEVFGIREMIFCFSGRRGFHVIVTQKNVFELENHDRAKFYDFFHQDKIRINNYIHAKIYQEIILPRKESIFTNLAVSTNKFHSQEEEMSWEFKTLMRCVWPRLDKEVTVQVNHLTKCPLSIHYETKKICWILDPESTDRIDEQVASWNDRISHTDTSDQVRQIIDENLSIAMRYYDQEPPEMEDNDEIKEEEGEDGNENEESQQEEEVEQ
jgi:DNA primase catalytic subunit